ncbi:MAG: hypothetical protein IT350_14815 [Deltaproteobacteria bacterium]|nr:hypothetical protein [Deltaproteobacteria bacterium]
MNLRKVAFTAIFVSVIAVSAPVFAAGPAEWIVLPPLPEPITAFAAAADSRTGDVHVFGGSSPGGTYAQGTWVFRGGTWSRQEIPADMPAPEPRVGHVMVSTPDGIVLFGGMSDDGRYLGDTWVLAGDVWTRLTSATAPPARSNPGAAWDSSSNAVLLFGGFGAATGDLNDTWLLRDGRWQRASSPDAPSPRSLATMVGRAETGSVLLVGGFGPGANGELEDIDDRWIRRGGAWSRLDVVPHPPRRSNARAVRDPVDGRAYIFSGFGDGAARDDLWSFDGASFRAESPPSPVWSYATVALVENARAGVVQVVRSGDDAATVNENGPHRMLDDAWTFDGDDWNAVTAEPRPSPRAFASMAFDLHRGVYVLFGGGDDTHPLGDTWEFDGKRWTKIETSTAPSARVDHRMVYDPARRGIWLFGGFGRTGNPDEPDAYLADAWLYRDGRWEPQPGAALDAPRSRHVAWIAARGGPIVAFGQRPEAGDLADARHWSGKAWDARPWTGPDARSSASAGFAGGRIVLFGGASRQKNRPFGDTWILDSDAWIEHRGTPAPPARFDAALASLSDGGAVLFGGFDNARELGDTWIFDGSAWKELASKNAPVARRGAAFAAGPRGALLFGGMGGERAGDRESDAPRVALETWAYNGDAWRRIPTTTTPSAVIGFGWCYNRKREIGVLFGGFNEKSGDLAETWVFDGRDWKRVATTTTPPARTNPNLVWDPRDRTILLFGGHSQTSGALRDVWRFDGKDWTSVRGTGPPAPFTGGTNMIYSDDAREFWLFGVRPAAK